MKQLMIDEETMGGPPDGALVGLGAAFFDLDTYEIGATFYRSIHLATSVRLGMKMDAATVLWWLRQNSNAQMAIATNLCDITKVLQEFREFIVENCRIKDVRVWGNGSTFDLTILGTAYRLMGEDPPWTYGLETCFRTVRNMNPAVPYEPQNRKTVHHHALDDAIFQIEHLFAIKRFNEAHPRQGL